MENVFYFLIKRQPGILPAMALGALHMNGFPPICQIGVNKLFANP